MVCFLSTPVSLIEIDGFLHNIKAFSTPGNIYVYKPTVENSV